MHGFTCLQDFIGYFESARQHGEPRCLYVAAAGCPALLLVGWPSAETALHLNRARRQQCYAFTLREPASPATSHCLAAEVEQQEVVAPWKVLEPDPLRNKGPVVQVRVKWAGCPALAV